MASHPPFQLEDNTDEDFFDRLVADDFGPGESSAGFDSDDAKLFANLSVEDSGGEGGSEAKQLSDSVNVAAVSSVEHEVDGSNSLVASNLIGMENVVAPQSITNWIGSEVAVESAVSKGLTGMESVVAQQSNTNWIGSEVAVESAVSKGIGSDVAMDSGVSKGTGSGVTMDSMVNKGIGSEATMDSTVSKGTGSEAKMDSATDKSIGSGDSGVKEVGWGSFYADSAQNGDTALEPYSEFFSEVGDSSGYFSGNLEETFNVEAQGVTTTEERTNDGLDNSVNHVNYQDDQVHGASNEQNADAQDMNSSEYWENLYPGWKYDSNTGQWYQLDGYHAAEANTQESVVTSSETDWKAVSDGTADVSYLQTAQSIAGTVTEPSTSEAVSNWDQVSQVNGGYPEHMVFDPQYPGWYFDTIAQEWRSLEAENSSLQSTVQDHSQQSQNGYYSQNNNYEEFGEGDNNVTQGLASQGDASSWSQSYTNHSQQGVGMWQPEPVSSYKESALSIGGTQQLQNSSSSKVSMNNHGNQRTSGSSFGEVQLHDNNSHYRGEANGTAELNSFAPVGNFSQHLNQASAEENLQMHLANGYYESSKLVNEYHGSQEQVSFPQQSFQNGNQFSPDTGRSSAGRPPHALVTFGFGGKLVVMKDSSLRNSSYGSQDPAGGSISVLNLVEVVMANANGSSPGNSSCDYFLALCQQSFPGPLVGGNVGNKDLNKWLDERIASCESADMDYRKSESLRLLLYLLKIACQHYGKLRSPFGTDSTTKEDDLPESAVAKLFASAKKNGAQFSEYGTLSQCLQNLPSEGQIRATASQVQNLLVSGKKIEALHCAKEGRLWGPALVLASQMGDQFYVDTVKQMALQQLVAGSPMRTLCLLIAGQPAEVFSTDATSGSNLPAAMNMSQQPAQFGANGMLDDWEENLAVITANRTKDDELVIIHLGDSLWRERSEILAAHICYLIAEANFESYSDSARLCLIGADHWKLPRTFASPEAIQRTELHEYSKVLGNSQFILLPFQPYKLIYAYMLAEVGKVSESLKYCQALLKSLKTGRAPEVETWKQLVLSLEERIRTHQQGGYSVNLAPAKLVGKLLNFFDSTAHRVVGGIPPPAQSITRGGIQSNEQYYQPIAPRVSTSQSTMAMSSLVPSASMEPISHNRADGNRMMMPNRSASEPNIGRTPRQVDSSTDLTPKDAQDKSSGGASRFTRFGLGSQFLQKTMGLVLKSRSDKQAKLGEKNKFYYDENLKRWVEEGVDPPAEEAALPPPPTTASFQSGMSDYNLKSAIMSDGSPPTGGSPKFKNPAHASGIPPIPPTSNQFSARGRMGVRSRYVDTFNQGGASAANSFQSPPVPSIKPAVTANPKFFIPAALVSSAEPTVESISASALSEQNWEAVTSPVSSEHTIASMDEDSHKNPSAYNRNYSFQSPPPPTSSVSLQRYPSMDNIQSNSTMTNRNDGHLYQSRRTASWSGGSGSFSDAYSPPQTLGKALGITPSSSFMPSDPRMGGNFGDELHEVDL